MVRALKAYRTGAPLEKLVRLSVRCTPASTIQSIRLAVPFPVIRFAPGLLITAVFCETICR